MAHSLEDTATVQQTDLESAQERIEKRIAIFNKLWIIFIVLGAIAVLIGLIFFDLRSDKGLESLGNYSSGTVVAFWSLAGVVLIYLAFLGQKQELLLQKEELRLNRIELEETREVLREQKEEFALQNKTLLSQNFQNLFFQMLRNHSDIVHHIDLDTAPRGVSGRDCFKVFYRTFTMEYNKLKQDQTSELDSIERAYSKCYDRYRIDLSHYFRNLYNFVKLIDRSDVSDEDKRMYMNTLKAQLSTFELALLFYNCLSSYGSKRFKPLVEKYNLVKNLPDNELADKEHVRLYKGIEL